MSERKPDWISPCGAVQLGRRFIGIELERRYFDMAVRRISEVLLVGEGQLFAAPARRENTKCHSEDRR